MIGIDEPKKVGIIGGEGAYGKYFRKFFDLRGDDVLFSDIEADPSNEEVVEWADVVLIAVPILDTVDVLLLIKHLLRKNQLIIDITSAKNAPSQVMLESLADVLPTHPFCAPPKNGNFEGQTIFVCPGRLTLWKNWVAKFLEDTRANLVYISPFEHDKARAVDQVIEHMCSLLKVAVMERLGVNPDGLLKISSPVYKLSTLQMARIFVQSPELYAGIPMTNVFAVDAIATFEEELIAYKKVIVERDAQAFREWFNKRRAYIGSRNIQDLFIMSEKVNELVKKS